MRVQHEKKLLSLFSYDAIIDSSYPPKIRQALGNICALLGKLLGEFNDIPDVYLLDDKNLPEKNVELSVLKGFNPGLYVRACDVIGRNAHVYLIEVQPSKDILIHENIDISMFNLHSDKKLKNVIINLNSQGKVIGRHLQISGGGYRFVAALMAHYAFEQSIGETFMPSVGNVKATSVSYPPISAFFSIEWPRRNEWKNEWEKCLLLNFNIKRDESGDISSISQKLQFLSVFHFINEEQFGESDKAWVKHLDKINRKKESVPPETPMGKWLKSKMDEHGIKYADEQGSKNSLS